MAKAERESVRKLRCQVETIVYSASSDIVNGKPDAAIPKILYATVMDKAADQLALLQKKYKI